MSASSKRSGQQREMRPRRAPSILVRFSETDAAWHTSRVTYATATSGHRRRRVSNAHVHFSCIYALSFSQADVSTCCTHACFVNTAVSEAICAIYARAACTFSSCHAFVVYVLYTTCTVSAVLACFVAYFPFGNTNLFFLQVS